MIKKTEYQIQCECVHLLETYKLQKKIDFFTAIPNSTFIPATKYKKNGFDYGRKKILDKLKKAGVRPGLCDLMIVAESIPYFVELKTETGTLQASQKEVIKHLNKRFILAYIATSLEEFKVLLDDIIKSAKRPLNLETTDYYKNNKKGARMLKKLLNFK